MAQYSDYTVAYENNRGNKIILTELPYAINIEPLLDYSWAYATRDRRRGSRVAGFNKAVASQNIILHVLSKSVDERNKAIDEFNNIIEADIYDGKPGKMWFGDWYTYGYIVSSSNSKWQYGKGIMKKNVSFVREEETWFHIISRNSYAPIEQDEDSEYEQGLKDYELNPKTGLVGYDYSYDYGVDQYSAAYVINPNSTGCNFIMNISGKVTNPKIQIGENVIEMNVDIPDGAYLIIDSTEKTIMLYYADGTVFNAFGARSPDHYIFKLIEPGYNAIVWNGMYNWDLQVVEERSEPRWHMD